MSSPEIPQDVASEPVEDVEVEQANNVEEKPSGRILAQRAILAADAYWGIGYGDFSRGDPRASRRMEP